MPGRLVGSGRPAIPGAPRHKNQDTPETQVQMCRTYLLRITPFYLFKHEVTRIPGAQICTYYIYMVCENPRRYNLLSLTPTKSGPHPQYNRIVLLSIMRVRPAIYLSYNLIPDTLSSKMQF